MIKDRLAIHSAIENNASVEAKPAAKYDAQIRALEQQIGTLTIVANNKTLTQQTTTTSTTAGPTIASTYNNRPPNTSTDMVPRAPIGRTQVQVAFPPGYLVQIQGYKNEHGEDVRIEWAVPLLGRSPLGSGGMQRNLKLHFIEQKKRKLHNDLVRANRAAGFITATVVEPANFIGGSNFYSNQVQPTENQFTTVKEGNDKGQES
ncbi:hypothetical protein QFC20_004015 [Naganishia adeliensis]|uniref:Uncharacterized protein n=1 Tax=Naganishia adeliensis TaxID=92952 RepID=A0ACC2W6E8_9TREE|nr:hypothetical protein QFC20_004015 [Naganishia adeliensis]